MLARKGLRVSHRIEFEGIHHKPVTNHRSEEIRSGFETPVDVTRNPKRGYQWHPPQRRTDVLQKFILKKTYPVIFPKTRTFRKTHISTRMHSSRMRTARSSSRLGRHPLPVDTHTPVNILPCPKLRLRAVTSYTDHEVPENVRLPTCMVRWFD